MKRLITCLSTMLLLLVTTRAGADNEQVNLTGNFTSWGGNYVSMSRQESSSTKFSYTFNSGSKETIYFKVQVVWKGGGILNLGPKGNDKEIEANGLSIGNGYDNYDSGDKAFCFQCDKYTNYTICYDLGDYTDGFKNMSISYSKGEYVAPVEGIDYDAYYFVSPELTGGEKLPRFRLIPSRERTYETTVTNPGAVSNALFTLNLKDDEIEKLAKKYEEENNTTITNNTIRYYIAKGDGGMNYRPSTDNYELASTGEHDTSTEHCNEGKNVVYNAVLSNKASSTEHYFILKYGQNSTKTECTDQKLRSYTWMLNTENGYVSLCKNISLYQRDKDPSFYLIGNLNNAIGGSANWTPNDSKNRFLMTKNVYKNPDTQVVDSIVYTATIKKPKEGWGNLYIGVAEGYLFDDNDFSIWDWDNIIRPQVNWRADNRRNGLDATALEGGLFIDGGTGDQNNNQSLNPDISSLPNSDEIESFTFSMNVTTATYRIIFNRGFYIIGEAVSNDDVTAGWEKENAIKMDFDTEGGYWYKTVNMESGKNFRFYNDQTMTNCFVEDDNAPGKPNTSEELKGEDTQYVNQVKWYNEGQESYNEEAMRDRDVVFRLPTGKYKIFFYSKSIDGGDNAGNDATRIYYAIERDFTLRKPTGTTLKEVEGFSDKHLKAFSNYHAVNIPENVKAYIVSNTKEKGENEEYATATVTEWTENYIPANTGVLLTYAGEGDEITKDVHFTYYNDPFYNTDGKHNIEDNKLMPQVISTHILFNGGEGKYNYIFGYKKLKSEDAQATLGFYIPGAGNCAANTAYLQTDFATATGDAVSYSKKGIVFSFGSETTGITDIQAVKEEGGYYTLQGIKVERPTKGIYIHNGKKVIIK